ncbi:MAG: Ppx/GppA phosphatase family protein [Candidatus Aquicultor sp.]
MNEMKIGAIDIGTNSVRLLIAEKNGGWRDMRRELEITRLGEDVNRTCRIKPEAMERTLAALAKHKDLLERYAVENVRVVATSAMRDAANSADFMAMVKERLGLSIEVIPGEEEGRLTFAGVAGPGSLVTPDELALVVDVGGGSTEYIYGRNGTVFGSTSLNIGSVRLYELFIKHDPPLAGELESAREMIQTSAGPVFEKLAVESPDVVIAVAGTATQLAAIYYGVDPYDPEKIHGSRISVSELSSLIKQLAAMPVEQRRALKGMHPKRADVIVTGALILEETLLGLGFPEMIISEKDILDGIAYSIG